MAQTHKHKPTTHRQPGGNRHIDSGSRSVTSVFIVLAVLVMAALAWSISRDNDTTTNEPTTTGKNSQITPEPASERVFDPLTDTLQKAQDAASHSDNRKQNLDEQIEQQ